MDSWKRFDETLFPGKEAFYSSLNMEVGNKNLGDYHDWYVQSDTILLADVFENFRNMCIKL